mmetsp:Transcript_10078/g.15303  ORF Transcript_10078/g.15303 Transcript_10078/m.15303 type:complete len:267 (+) Transcript_10078:458-1258(+)
MTSHPGIYAHVQSVNRTLQCHHDLFHCAVLQRVQGHLKHPLDQCIDFSTTLPGLAALVVVEQLLGQPAPGAGQLERPQEVVGLLEVRPAGVDLMNEVLHTDDASGPQHLLYHAVVTQRLPLLVHLSESALVDEVLDALEGGVPVGHVGLHQAQHLDGGGVQLHKHPVVDLAQAQQLQDLAHLGGDADDTADADDKGDLGLRGHVEVAKLLGLPAQTNLRQLQVFVLLYIFLRTLEDHSLLLLGSLLGLQEVSSFSSLNLFESTALL